MALQAGCQQQPARGVVLGLNDTIFSEKLIHIVDPATLIDEGSSSPALPTPSIVGTGAGALVFALIVAATTFVGVRKRKNRRARAKAEAEFYGHFTHRPKSATSFQCQTHMMSPRLWPGAEHAVTSPGGKTVSAHDPQSSAWKPHDAIRIKEEPLSPYQDDNTLPVSKKAAHPAAVLPHLTTSIPPPPRAHTSPLTGDVYSPSDFNPLSADSVRSTAALLPSIKAYVPAEHGQFINGSPVPASASTFSSPTSATGATPLLRSGTWSEQQTTTHKPHKRQKQHAIGAGDPVPPPPTPPKTGRNSGAVSKKNAKNNAAGTGSPVESWEIQTAFAAPPKR